MLDVTRRTNFNMYPTLLKNNSLVMSLTTLGKPASAAHARSTCGGNNPVVKAATTLGPHSSTEVVDVSGLSQAPSSLIQYVEIADVAGRLYCVDRHVSTACWLKIVTIAKDCQSCNVLLMTTDKGIVLKTIRSIVPGEPLLMWFTENILAMLNMPYLTNLNIKGQNRYICHICNNNFEYPNPLKIHIALQCNRLDSNHLWSELAREINATPVPALSSNLFQNLPPFSFKLVGAGAPLTAPTSPSLPSLPDTIFASSSSSSNRRTPALLSSSASTYSINNHSPTPSNRTSPTSSIHTSPTSPGQLSYCSSSSSVTRVSDTPIKKHAGVQRHSAFKPYCNKPRVLPKSVMPPSEKMILPTFHMHPPTVAVAPMIPDAPVTQMESFVNNLGKGKAGHLCLYCGKVYSRKYGLKIHIRTHTGYKPLKCKYCLRPFGDPSNLNKHVRLHADGDTPYRCDLCGKVLVRRRDLERHIRSRHQNHADHPVISDVSSDGTDIC